MIADIAGKGTRLGRTVAPRTMTTDPRFPELVSLACHDLRTPLATVAGFASTLLRVGTLDQQGERYVGLIEAASGQLAAIIDDLNVAASIQAGRWEPAPEEVDTLELARGVAEELGPGVVAVSGRGATVRVDRDAATRALAGLTKAALRHGRLERVGLAVDANAVTISPLDDATAGIVRGELLRDLGAAAGRAVIEALGGHLRRGDDSLVVDLPVTPA